MEQGLEMTVDNLKSAQEKIAALRDAFAANISERIGEIEDAARPLNGEASASDCRAALKSVTTLSHTLGGGAGTFGFTGLGSVARQLEVFCSALLDAGDEPQTSDFVHIRKLLSNLRSDTSTEYSLSSLEKELSSPWPASPSKADESERISVIVVEDDKDHSSALELLLGNFGFDVHTIDHPSNLPEALEEIQPSAVIMDIMFPGDDAAGLTSVGNLRMKGKLTCPVIFLSVRDDFSDRLDAIRAGGDGYIVKPVNIVELADALGQVVASRKKKPYRIMIIDDDHQTAEFYRTILTGAGMDVDAETDPEKAIRSLKRFNPDLILMDIRMPRCNGMELSAMIRQMTDRFLQVPIVFLTAEDTLAHRYESIRIGANDFLPKTAEPAFVISTVSARAERFCVLNDLFSRLKSSEEQFRSVAQSANEAIVSADDRGLIVFWNDAAERIFGYGESEILGRSITRLVRGKDQDLFVQALESDKAGAGPDHMDPSSVEAEGLRKNGAVVPLELSLASWMAGGRRYITSILRDISKRKEAEAALRQAVAGADAANNAKTMFLSSMSHELRTPLNAILGFGQLLSHEPKDPLSSDQAECLKHIMDSGNHLLGLINDILDMSKIEAGEVTLTIEPVAAKKVLKHCIALTRQLATDMGISVVDETTESAVPRIVADHGRLRQVLLNLLSNAVKYNTPGGRVTVGCTSTDGGMLRIAITDTGPGIPKDKQGLLFEPFSRLGAEATDIEGTGIGLTITRQLVELMHGRIGFDSQVGRGSTFWIDLPLVDEEVDGEGAAEEEAERISEATRAKVPHKVRTGTRTMLYVEDNPANLKLMEEVIGLASDVTLLVAENAEKGLEMALSHRPDVILMDINLPGMDGYQALEHLLADQATRNIPVIALSADAMPGDVKKGLKAGFHGYLTKPIRIDDILSALENVFEEEPCRISGTKH